MISAFGLLTTIDYSLATEGQLPLPATVPLLQWKFSFGTGRFPKPHNRFPPQSLQEFVPCESSPAGTKPDLRLRRPVEHQGAERWSFPGGAVPFLQNIAS